METIILATVYNEEFGTAAVVAEITKGFSVSLFDVDAEKYIPLGCTIFPRTMANAEALAYERAFTV